MQINWSDVLTSLMGAVVGITAAWLGLKGSKAESSVTFNGDLLKAQAERIDKLEERQAALEDKLDETRAMLYLEEDRTHKLRRALEDALEWLRDLIDWTRSDRMAPPPEPDIQEISRVLHASYARPTARNPPDSS